MTLATLFWFAAFVVALYYALRFRAELLLLRRENRALWKERGFDAKAPSGRHAVERMFGLALVVREP